MGLVTIDDDDDDDINQMPSLKWVTIARGLQQENAERPDTKRTHKIEDKKARPLWRLGRWQH